MIKLLPRIAAVLLLCASAFASGRVECSTVKSTALRMQVPYCALLPPSYDDKAKGAAKFPVLYMLHGLGDNHQSLINTGGWNLIERLQREKKIGDFIIVTPAAGNSFYVNSRSGKVRYEDFFVREFMPAIEKIYRVKPGRAHRGISGISMGGYGALRFAFKYPAMFNAVSAHSAALLEDFPKGSDNVMGLDRMLGGSFGVPLDQAYWKRNTPFAFARNSSLRGLKIYFDCGDRDQYGFESGARALARLLSQRKVPHIAHIYPGGHDWDYFSEHLDESLLFQSKAFGLTK